LYCSGTTGTPKGVMITQRAMVAGVSGAHTMMKQAGVTYSEADSTLSFMPLAHIFDRIIEELVLSAGASVGYFQVRRLVRTPAGLRNHSFDLLL